MSKERSLPLAAERNLQESPQKLAFPSLVLLAVVFTSSNLCYRLGWQPLLPVQALLPVRAMEPFRLAHILLLLDVTKCGHSLQ